MFSKSGLFSLLLLVSLSTAWGCATHADRLRAVRGSYYSGNVLSAKEKIEEEIKKGKRRDLDVLKLDQSMIELFSGDLSGAKRSLREVRDRFDQLEQKSVREGILSMLTDDNAVAYSGEDYEKVMIRTMLTFADLLDGGNDAAAYSLQINLKQEEIMRNEFGKIADPKDAQKRINPKSTYKFLAVGEYLRGLIREETLTNYDDARRSYERVVQWEPGFLQGKADLHRVVSGRHSSAGNGVVYLFSFVGRGPYKEKDNAEATQLALLIADQVFSATNKYSVPPTVAPVPIPKVVAPYNRIQTVAATIDGRAAGNTETITNVSKIACEQFDAIRDQIIARAVMRRVVKKGTIYAAKQATEVNPWVGLAMDLGGVAWEATETADTRCWGLLPEKIQVLRIELPEGEHELTLQPQGSDGIALGRQYRKTLRVFRGRNSYILANFPDERLIGEIVGSRE